MKLKNKKTGEIRELPDGFFCSNNLKKICEEWEDYKPKEYWYSLDARGEVCEWSMECFSKETKDEMKAIGNYFDTREEGKRVVEKLKAWKRLKDKCCISFSGLNRNIKGRPVSVNLDFNIEGRTTFDEAIQNTKDLMLLFGGEDESSN